MNTYSEWFRDFWHYRELFYFLAWRDIKVRYKQTALGVTWALIQPVVNMLVFTLLFGKIAQLPSDGMPYPVFYFCALLPWTYFASTLGTAGNSLVHDPNLITKVYFPRAILPASAAISGLVDFCIGSVLLLGILGYYDIAFDWRTMLWPVLVILLVILSFGVGLILSALNVQYRDVKYVIPFAVQFLLFATPVIYSTNILPDRYRVLAAFNPLTGIIEGFRAVLVPTRPMDWSLLGISTVLTLAILLGGTMYFRRTERFFADVI
ncbi:MAG: ABC transporter permease [Candidatus Binatia bacterium]